ncbi:unnamed protein product [Cochlearia groenlandica]
MPSGAKKRKALRKKKQQEEAIVTTNSKGFNGDDNLHRHDEHGSQDERGSDSNLSSPGSQGNQEFGTKDTSDASPVKDAAKEISEDGGVAQGLGLQCGNAIAVQTRTNGKKSIAETSPDSSSESSTQAVKNVACDGNSDVEIAPVVDTESKVSISEKTKHVETSTQSSFVKQKEIEENPSRGPGKENGKVATLPGSAAGTSERVEIVRESEVPVSSEEKSLLLPGPPPPPAVRTSWLSCCGLFDAMTGSDR